MTDLPWGRPVALRELARGPLRLRLEPDAATRASIARELRLESLPALVAEVEVRPWLDGAEIAGRFDGRVEQICGVSLEPFEQPISGTFDVKALPPGSPNAVEEAEPGGELTLDLDAPDPPDRLEGEELDVTGYVLEHLALEIDPFPRKPGATFDYSPPPDEESPFAVLKQLKNKED
ncbi:DUF177 domain-containing protein [Phenylobacterium sp.]|uniref:YceD family protein n=1 Tax=Phenylobacterium sp. TaxID=1871053 RepID=UPI0035B2479C